MHLKSARVIVSSVCPSTARSVVCLAAVVYAAINNDASWRGPRRSAYGGPGRGSGGGDKRLTAGLFLGDKAITVPRRRERERERDGMSEHRVALHRTTTTTTDGSGTLQPLQATAMYCSLPCALSSSSSSFITQEAAHEIHTHKN